MSDRLNKKFMILNEATGRNLSTSVDLRESLKLVKGVSKLEGITLTDNVDRCRPPLMAAACRV